MARCSLWVLAVQPMLPGSFPSSPPSRRTYAAHMCDGRTGYSVLAWPPTPRRTRGGIFPVGADYLMCDPFAIRCLTSNVRERVQSSTRRKILQSAGRDAQMAEELGPEPRAQTARRIIPKRQGPRHGWGAPGSVRPADCLPCQPPRPHWDWLTGQCDFDFGFNRTTGCQLAQARRGERRAPAASGSPFQR